MMNIRDKLQDKWASDLYSNNVNGRGIAHLCPRAGKIRTSIKFFEILKRQWKTNVLNVLICYPDKNIQKSWEDDFKTVNYDSSDVEYVTHISLEKVKGHNYDVIIIDEIHLLSAKQKSHVKRLISENKSGYTIGLSGTLSEKTEIELRSELNMPVITEYTIEEAIQDGIISDYKINVIRVSLDDVQKIYKKNTRTEKAQYRAYSWVIESKGHSLMLNLGRMRVLHNSLAKTKATIEILDKLKDERTLVFCPNNKVAKSLGCKLHTSKINNQEAFDNFITGKGNNHMAVCKIGNTGVSFKSLRHIVVNAFDSNSENLTQRICRSLILDSKDKVSEIYIVCSKEKAELKWLEKSLEFFNPTKIKYYDK